MNRVIGFSAVVFARNVLGLLAVIALFIPMRVLADGGWVLPVRGPGPPSWADIYYCAIENAPSVSVYIFHARSDGSQGIRYMATPSPCSPWVWVSETSSFPSTGDSQTGIEVTYGECPDVTPATIHVQTITFAGGSLVGCCLYILKAYPGDAALMSKRCDGEYEPAEGLAANLRPHGTPVSICSCNVDPLPTPTEASTWGVIKALFALGE